MEVVRVALVVLLNVVVIDATKFIVEVIIIVLVIGITAIIVEQAC